MKEKITGLVVHLSLGLLADVSRFSFVDNIGNHPEEPLINIKTSMHNSQRAILTRQILDQLSKQRITLPATLVSFILTEFFMLI